MWTPGNRVPNNVLYECVRLNRAGIQSRDRQEIASTSEPTNARASERTGKKEKECGGEREREKESIENGTRRYVKVVSFLTNPILH